MNDRQQRIEQRLRQAFSPVAMILEDESAQHAGHAGAASGGSHFRLRIVAAVFAGRNRIERHRLVYDCLGDLMHNEIHALAINALAPGEAGTVQI
jgi:BolA protein